MDEGANIMEVQILHDKTVAFCCATVRHKCLVGFGDTFWLLSGFGYCQVFTQCIVKKAVSLHSFCLVFARTPDVYILVALEVCLK